MSSRARVVIAVCVALGVVAGAALIVVGLAPQPDGLATLTTRPAPPAPGSATPLRAVDPKLASLLAQLYETYQREGLAKARKFAEQNRLIDSKGIIRMTLDLDSADPAVEREVAQQLELWGVTIEARHRASLDVAITLGQLTQTLALPTPGLRTPALNLTAIAGNLPPSLLEGLVHLTHVTRIHLPEGPSPKGLSASAQEAVAVIKADAWLQSGITGAGMRVGVLDVGGFLGYRDLLGGALPEKVQVGAFNRTGDIEGNPEDVETTRVHGTACAEAVHAVAPQADLYLASFDTGGSEAEAVDWLVSQGVQIISASFGSDAAPGDGSGWEPEMIDKLRARGLLWVNSAGNEADEHFGGRFNQAADGYNLFGNGTETLGFKSQDSGWAQITLRWYDWQERKIDYDLLLLDANGQQLTKSADVQNGGANPPVELIQYQLDPDTQYYLAISAAADTAAVAYDLFAAGPLELEATVAQGSLTSPADARGALAVAAVDWRNDRRAVYSSEGPTTDGRLKPEIAAPVGYTTESYPRFTGTSAAAPIIAGAAALYGSSAPDASVDEVQSYLLKHSLDLGDPGPDLAYGAGRLELPAPPVLAATPTASEAGAVAAPTTAPPTIAQPSATATPTSRKPTPLAATPTRTAVPTPTNVPAQGGTNGGSGSLLIVLGAGLIVGCLFGGGVVWFATRPKPRSARPATPPQPPRPGPAPSAPPTSGPTGPTYRPSGAPARPLPPAPPPSVSQRSTAPPTPHPPPPNQPRTPQAQPPAIQPPRAPTPTPGRSPAAPGSRVFCPRCGKVLNKQSGNCHNCGWRGP